MPNTIRQLVEAHEFLRSALQTYGNRLAPTEAARLKDECDAQFLKILRHRSTAPSVTLAQVKFMLESLERLSNDPVVAHELASTCLEAVARLVPKPNEPAGRVTAKLPRSGEACALPSAADNSQFVLLNSTSDRIAIIDRDYKYIFSNQANAEFHGLQPSEIIGTHVSSVVGEDCFRKITKPMLDECFAGNPTRRQVRHTWREPSITCSVLFEPLHDDRGGIAYVLGTVRDITSLNQGEVEVPRMPDN